MKLLLSCRFGTVKSINVVKHSSDKNLATKLEECQVLNEVNSKEASQDTPFVNAESSFSEEATYSKSKGTSGMEFQYDKELEEDENNDGCSANDDKNAEVFDSTSCEEHLVSDTTVKDAGNKSMPSSSIQGCPDHQDTPNDEPEELHDKMVANEIDVDIEDKMVDGNVDSKNTDCPLQEGFSERDTGTELVGPRKGINEEDDVYDGHVFEPGSVLVEYGRTEACRSAAHCLHGRFFDGRMVTVEYISLSLYRARFTK